MIEIEYKYKLMKSLYYFFIAFLGNQIHINLTSYKHFISSNWILLIQGWLLLGLKNLHIVSSWTESDESRGSEARFLQIPNPSLVLWW